MWQVRHIVEPRPSASTPLMRALIPLDGEEPSILCTSWHDAHSILPLNSIALAIVFPVREVPDQVDGTGAVVIVNFAELLASPIL